MQETTMSTEELVREQEKLKNEISQLHVLQNGIVSVVADMVEHRGKVIEGHIEQTTEYVRIVIEAMLDRGVYGSELREMDLEMLVAAARMYDIGKIAIPDIIIYKPGKLSNDEFEIMKTHAMKGERIIEQMAVRVGSEMDYLHHAKLFAGFHHERWDGKGYPHGLDRLNIPLQGRIIAIVDVYNALVSHRPYKNPFTPEEAVKIIMDSTGEMFDPLIAETFFVCRSKLEMVKDK